MRAGGALPSLLPLLWLAAGCLESGAVVCADGRVCPAGLLCSDANRRCVSQEQIDACAGLAELATCEVAGGGSGECRGGACLFSICGDGRVEGAETCDGDNLGEGTDCVEIGYYDPQPLTCDPSCQLDQSACTGGRCGDQIVNGPELCDGPAPDLQCVHIGYDVGALPACTARCEPDTSLCHRVGIDRISLAEGDPPQDLIGTGADDVYTIARLANAIGGPLYHFDGTSWLRVFDDAYSVWPVARDDVYATVRREDAVTLQHFDGGGWMVVDGVTPGLTQRVRASGPDDIDLLGTDESATSQHWDGRSWTDITDLPAGDVIDMWAAAPPIIYLVLAAPPGNLLVRFDGASWQTVDHGLALVSAVWGTGPDDVWIGGDREVGHWDGTSWKIDSDPLPDPGEVVSITGTAGDDVYLVAVEYIGISGSIIEIGHLTHFDGAVWTSVAELPGVHDAWAAGPEAVFLAGNAGTTYRYQGSLWRPEISQEFTPGHIPVGFAFRGDELIAAFNFSAFTDTGFVYHVSGDSWSVPEQLSTLALNGLFSSGDTVYVVGDEGLFRLDPDDSWSKVDVGKAEPGLMAGWSSGPGVRFAVGVSLFHNIGDGWVETALPSVCALAAGSIWGSSANDVFAVGGCGSVFHFDGEAWAPMESGTGSDLQAVWGRGPDDVYAVGKDSTALHFDGSSWSAMPPLPVAIDLDGLWGTEGELFATSAQGFILHFDGHSWSPLEPDAVLDRMAGLGGRDHEIVFMSMFGTDVSFLRLLRTTDWAAP